MSEAELHGQKPDHPYHLVEPSVWPLVGAVSAGVLAAGMVLYMHDVVGIIVPIGLVLVILTMILWWRDARGGERLDEISCLPPPAPHRQCGVDSTEGLLQDCEEQPQCAG